MRKLLLLLAVAFLVGSCSKDIDEFNQSKILIKGIIPTSGLKSARAGAAEGLSLSDARKVLVFNSSTYNVFNISDSAFAARAGAGTASALAFLDEGNRFIGCLCVGGMNVLPLVSLKDGDNTIIDLSTLTLDGTLVYPANDPIGDEINLSDDEIERYRELGAYYESLSKNIDADNDGLADILYKKEFNISTIFSVYAGRMGIDNTSPVLVDTAGMFINYIMRIAGSKNLVPANQTIMLTGPAQAPYTDINQMRYAPAPDGFITFFNRQVQEVQENNPLGNVWLPFARGTYTVTLDGKDYTLNYSNISARHFLILAIPTVHTDDKGLITSITVDYRDMNNEPVNTENFVFQTAIWLHGSSGLVSQIGGLWENPEAVTYNELYNFTTKDPVEFSMVDRIEVGYQDLIGNVYNILFTK